MKEQNFFVYKMNNDRIWSYERTCGTEQAAKVRIAELKRQSGVIDAIYQTTLMEGAFY